MIQTISIFALAIVAIGFGIYAGYWKGRATALTMELALCEQRKDCCPDIMYAAMTPDLCHGLFVSLDCGILKIKHLDNGFILMVMTEQWCHFSDMSLPSQNQHSGQWQWMESGMTISGSHQDAVDHLMKMRRE